MALTGGSLTGAVRRALTFWRRSIQARVVMSTVVLSALVFSGVGWFLLQQTRDGLLDHRVKAVVAEANDETRSARLKLEGVLGTDLDAGSQLERARHPDPRARQRARLQRRAGQARGRRRRPRRRAR